MSTLKKPLLFFVTLLLTSAGMAQEKDAATKELETKWKNLKTYVLEMAESMPEAAYDFKPAPEQMSFLGQLVHMTDNIERLSYGYLLPDEEQDDVGSVIGGKAEVIELLGEAFDAGLRAHRSVSGTQWDEEVSFFAGPKTRRQMRQLLHAHQIHHVGQLIVYLRLKGIDPPKYVGW